MVSGDLRFRASLKDDVSTGLEKISDKFGMVKQQGAQGLFAGAAAAATVKAFSLVDSAVARLGDTLADSVQAAREEELSLAKLDAALQANVEGYDGNTDAIEKTIKARMSLGFADDEQRQSLARLVVATKDSAKALDIQRTAMDLARLKNIDLATATDALIRVESGQYRALKAMGIVLEEGATQTEALAAVQKAAAGQAEAYMDTSAGKALELDVKLGELSETAGMILLPAVNAVTDGLIEFADAVSIATDDSASAVDRLSGLVDVLDTLNPATWSTKAAMDGVTDAIPDKEVGKLNRELDDGKGELKSYSKGLDRAGDEAKNLKKLMDGLVDSVEEATDAFLEAAFGPKELRLKLKEAKDELGENKREIEKTQDKIKEFREAGKPVGELKDTLRDLRQEVIDNKKDAIETTARLEAMGKVPMGSTKAEIDRLIDAGDINEARTLYSYLNAIHDLGGGGGGGGGGGRQRRDGNGNPTSTPDGRGYANGGVMSAGSWGYVGERGMEKITALPGGGVAVQPMAGGSGGGPVVVQVVLDSRVIAEATAPGVTVWQQQRNLVGR